MSLLQELYRLALNVSNAPYQGESCCSIPDGWTNVNISGSSYENVLTGFKGAVYENVNGNTIEVTIAFAANGGGIDNFDNLSMLLGFVPSQFLDAYKLYIQTYEYYQQTYPDKIINFNFTGWSLGGALAQLMGACTGYNTVTFSAPGMGYALENFLTHEFLELYIGGNIILPVDPSLYNNIINYAVMNDPIGNWDTHIGQTYLCEPSELNGIDGVLANVHSDTGIYNFNDLTKEFISKPDNWSFKHSLALLVYDEKYREIAHLLEEYIAALHSHGVGVEILKEAIDIINKEIGTPTKKLHYSTPDGDYIIGTSEGENPWDTNQMLIGSESLLGIGGNDMIWGNEGGDYIYGFSGHDTIIGGSGSDTIYGGTGNDLLIGDSNNYTIEQLKEIRTIVENDPGSLNLADFEEYACAA